MQRCCGSWIFVLGFAAAVAALPIRPAAGQSPPLVNAEIFYFGLGAGSPYLQVDDVFHYDTAVPWAWYADTSNYPGSLSGMNIHIYTDDGLVDTWEAVGTFGAGEIAGVAREATVGLTFDVYSADDGSLLQSVRKTEGTTSLVTDFGDVTGAFPAASGDVSNFAKLLGEASIDAIFNSAFTSEVVSSQALQYDLTVGEVEGNVGMIKNSLKNQLIPLWSGATSGAYSFSKPGFNVHVGSSSPFLPAAQASISLMPNAMQNGWSGLLQDAVDVSLNTSGLQDWARSSLEEYHQTGSFSGPDADMVILNRLGVNFPLVINYGGVTMNGNAGVGVHDVSLNHFQGGYVNGEVGFHWENGGFKVDAIFNGEQIEGNPATGGFNLAVTRDY